MSEMPGQTGAGMADTRPALRLTCVECREEHTVQPMPSLDPKYLLAKCRKCKRVTAHVR